MSTMNTSEALAAWRSFLEITPPNTPVKISGLVPMLAPIELSLSGQLGFNTPHIQLYCESDDGLRRFDPFIKEIPIRSPYHFIQYQCRDCQDIVKTFAVLIVLQDNDSDVEVMKLGEYPPFSAPISSKIKKLLSRSDLELYQKGVRAETQGLGIGAATYFRRIVEEQWKRLVTEIRRAAERLDVKDLNVYDKALEETQFSKAVKMLKDAIPDKLLILDGENPLTLLYRPLSRQLHGLTDEECLQQAADIRLILTALLENIADVLRAQDELREAATRLKNLESQPTD